jgi:FixJ family two-component response regulator
MTHGLGTVPLMGRVQALQEKLAAQPGPAPIYPDGLTQLEVEVLRPIAAGRSNPEIAAELVISLNTVTRHVSNIFFKQARPTGPRRPRTPTGMDWRSKHLTR